VRLAALLTSILLVIGTADARERTRVRVVPIDDSRTDPSLAEMRDALLAAARAQDVTQLAPWLAPTIQEGFEAPVSRREFLRGFAPGGGEFWCQLRAALEGGIGKFRGEAYAPAFHLQAGRDSDMVINRPGVPLRRTPALASPVVAMLAYDLASPGPDDLVNGPRTAPPVIRLDGCEYWWRQVVTASGKRGWVPGKYVTEPLDTYFSFKKFGKKWLLTLIGAGD
jgi:hypothetical protein